MGVMTTWDDDNRLEDIHMEVMNISRNKTPLLTLLADQRVKDVWTIWPEDEDTTDQDNAQNEGADFTYPDMTDPTRYQNICQIIRKTYQVSDTERAVEGAGIKDMYTYKQVQKMREGATDLEKALVQGTLQSGNKSTARRMKGLLSFISTNATTFAANTKALSESLFNDMLEWIADQTDVDPDTVLCGNFLKRVVSGFTMGDTKNMDASSKKLTHRIDVYESDFGTQRILRMRNMPQGDGAANDICAFTKGRVKIGFLRKFKKKDVAQTGDSTKGGFTGEFTLKVFNEKACAKITGLARLHPK